MSDPYEHAVVLAMTEVAPGPWYELSELLEDSGSAAAVVSGDYHPWDERLAALAGHLAEAVAPAAVLHWQETIEGVRAALADASLVTVTDPTYPANLRSVYNRPPFLFIRGKLLPEDARSVAVVGTRRASPQGKAQARHLASELAGRGVTVISGLATGIDTEAHTAALEAGGRTIAVMGTGIDRVYPRENRELAEQIVSRGALLSQFWPGAPPRGSNFPLRNVVTSGLAVGTVVIEANATSGAKMQARLALEHGKRLFLIDELVMHEQWAQHYAKRPGAAVVSSVDEVLEVLDREPDDADQLALF